MPAKLEVKIGTISFAGEGDDKWISDQLDKFLEKVPELTRLGHSSQISDNSTNSSPGSSSGAAQKAMGTLASFLRTKHATTKQVRKFLATAMWLADTQGKDRMTTTDITKALNDSNQSRLGNPSDCLAKNISKGFCDKAGDKQFFITDEGRQSLG